MRNHHKHTHIITTSTAEVTAATLAAPTHHSNQQDGKQHSAFLYQRLHVNIGICSTINSIRQKHQHQSEHHEHRHWH